VHSLVLLIIKVDGMINLDRTRHEEECWPYSLGTFSFDLRFIIIIIIWFIFLFVYRDNYFILSLSLSTTIVYYYLFQYELTEIYNT